MTFESGEAAATCPRKAELKQIKPNSGVRVPMIGTELVRFQLSDPDARPSVPMPWPRSSAMPEAASSGAYLRGSD